MSQLITDACAARASLERACDTVGVSLRTLQRWRTVAGLKADGRAAAAQGLTPANRLRKHERQAILALVNQSEFADGLAPGGSHKKVSDSLLLRYRAPLPGFAWRNGITIKAPLPSCEPSTVEDGEFLG